MQASTILRTFRDHSWPTPPDWLVEVKMPASLESVSFLSVVKFHSCQHKYFSRTNSNYPRLGGEERRRSEEKGRKFRRELKEKYEERLGISSWNKETRLAEGE